jgi:hypothetical protein
MTRAVLFRFPAVAAGLATLVVSLSLSTPVRAVSFLQVDNFQGGTTMNWAGATTSSAPNQGPGGAGDTALFVSSANRVATFNTTQWAGNYAGADVTKLVMDIRQANASLASMQMRIGIANGAFGPNGDGDTYVTGASAAVPNDGAWHRIAFSIRPADFAPTSLNTNPSPSAAAALASVTHLRIIHNPAANDFRGAQVNADFYLDNIRGVPEPSSGALAALAGLGLWARRRGRVA